ncbi:hypothetical protein DPMN_125376 [Dreissena polymorpha]|uniref:Uncharacterized protein n=1 Tax=Dreissena polymorpha TaxID=45954 RepID=A0A9D4GV68_DREPO|nr:hypothetical protein DPMN_125376 [Dreissena polymorpha]
MTALTRPELWADSRRARVNGGFGLPSSRCLIAELSRSGPMGPFVSRWDRGRPVEHGGPSRRTRPKVLVSAVAFEGLFSADNLSGDIRTVPVDTKTFLHIWWNTKDFSLARFLLFRTEADRRGKTSMKKPLAKARSSAAEAARSGPGRIYTRPAGRNYRPAVGGANGTRTIGHGFRAFDTESLDLSCLLDEVFKPKPGGDQSNISGCGESAASRIAQLSNWWVNRSRAKTRRCIKGDSQGDKTHSFLSFILSHASYRETDLDKHGRKDERRTDGQRQNNIHPPLAGTTIFK